MNDLTNAQRRVVVIGAGPAGLTAALELAKHAIRPIVLEKDNIVGGLARTEVYKNFRFDMGGHRFFTKSSEVQRLWEELLGEDFVRRPRTSRIYYKQRFFNYPLKPLNALRGLGLLESALVVASYIRWQIRPNRREDTFAQWVTNRFGQRLFRTFFQTYTEKVWGRSCSELSAEWAAQRIKNLSLQSVLLSTVIKPQQTITSLVEEFHYPRRGPGMMWAAAKARVEAQGGRVLLDSPVLEVHRKSNRIQGVLVRQGGRTRVLEGTDFISSMPLTEFVDKLVPGPPADILRAAERLSYRDFLTVCLIVDRPHLFPDNWIYIHDPEVKVGRIQNFKNWSPEMVPDPAKTSLGLEYFCDEGDELWTMPAAELIELGKRELQRLGLVRPEDIEDGCVFRVPKSYPVYDCAYRRYLGVLRRFIDGLENFQTIGRNGLHRYNNQDHSMLTGILAARNIALQESNDLWSVNTDQEYHEEARAAASTSPRSGGAPSDLMALGRRDGSRRRELVDVSAVAPQGD